MKPPAFWPLLLIAVAPLAGCAQPRPAPLYAWGDFARLQYEALEHRSMDRDVQIHTMSRQADAAHASGAALPPGFRAHLAFLELEAGQADAALDGLQAERAAFPESAPFIDPLILRIGAQRLKEHRQ